MPVYEYICNKCSREFERLVFGQATVTCTECGSQDVRKKMSSFGMGGGKKASPSGGGSRSSGCGSCSGSSCSSCH